MTDHCVAAGRYIARSLAELYRSVDPDVGRHLAQVPLLTYSLFSSRKAGVKKLDPDGHAPLIFVHGLGGSRGDFLPMSAYLLWHAGRSRTYSIYFRRGQTIPQMAKALARFIAQVRKVNDAGKVDIVSHSLGGVIARLAILDHSLAASVRTIVMLGSPHRGTFSARFGNSNITRELRPDSELMSRLGQEALPRRVKGISFWSRNDLMILPARSAALRGTRQVDMSPFTHYSYLIDPRSWAAVAKALD